ncbi:hypothetical protein PHYPSEUDO_006858 [Phytophthora pseudosyringae]|uniref:Uncharacterized protein n=1 Tax=Phytophthora pseudosyringae TaxID=221518 RepID=A0A8T1WGH0_9STRA|nr:hypothetical protein PHYPSEUDO_006858 [Phytophthora pseudosyringae]
MGVIDRRIATRLHQANDIAFANWIRTERHIYAMSPGAMLDWLSMTPYAFRHVLAYLPFPEPAAQRCSRQQLERWREVEMYLQQVHTIERIWKDEDSEDRARTYCATWLEHCRQANADDAMAIARDRARWEEISYLVDASLLRFRPVNIPLDHWFVLHVLPFTILSWKDTAMSRAPTSAMALWYSEYL